MNFASKGESERQFFNEINITPLTDIFLVLLIIMMVIAPSFQSVDNNIEMPQINSGLSIETKNATVSITKDGSFFVNEKKVSPESLEQNLSAIISNENKEVVVRADKKTKSSEIMKVMKAAQNAGFEKLVVAGEPLSKKEQKELIQNANEETES